MHGIYDIYDIGDEIQDNSTIKKIKSILSLQNTDVYNAFMMKKNKIQNGGGLFKINPKYNYYLK